MAGALWYPPGTNQSTGDSGLTKSEPRGWDAVYLDGRPLLSKAKVSKAGAKYTVDKKSANGKSAAKPTVRRYEEGEVEIEVSVRTQEDRLEMDFLFALIGPAPGRKARAITIQAEALSALPIKHVIVTSISAWSDGEPGWKRCSLSCLEYQASDKSAKSANRMPQTVNNGDENARTRAARKKGLLPTPPTQSKVDIAAPNFTPSGGA